MSGVSGVSGLSEGASKRASVCVCFCWSDHLSVCQSVIYVVHGVGSTTSPVTPWHKAK